MCNLDVLCRIKQEDEEIIIFTEQGFKYYILDTELRKHNSRIVNYIEITDDDLFEILESSKIIYLNKYYITPYKNSYILGGIY